MRWFKIGVCLMVALWLNLPGVKGQTADSVSSKAKDKYRIGTHRIGMDLRPGLLLQDNEFFQGQKAEGKPIQNAISAHLKYGFQFDRSTRLGRWYPQAYQGIGLSYNYLDAPQTLGSPVAVYAYQGSRIASLGTNVSLDYEWNFGASFGWKKQPLISNGYYGAVGSKINAYINLGFLMNWRLASHWQLAVGLDLTHYSNGNSHFPNSGVNLIGARVGLVRCFGEQSSVRGEQSTVSDFRPHFSYDLVVYGATRKRAIAREETNYVVPGSFGIAGFNFNPMYNFSRYFRAGMSLDAKYDESANLNEHYAGGGKENPKFFRPSFREQISVGLSARGEWVMPIFAVNFGVGYNVWQKGADTRGWYQILALKTSITRSLFLHVGYQLSRFKDPSHLMLGLGWRFH